MSEENEIKIELKYIRRDLDEIKANFNLLSKRYVTKDEFAPVKNIVYGLVALILTAVVGALITLVVR